MLRNLVTSLVEQESIRTTWPRAKEAQRVADKLITLAKRNTIASRSKAQGILFVRLQFHLSPPSRSFHALNLLTNSSALPTES